MCLPSYSYLRIPLEILDYALRINLFFVHSLGRPVDFQTKGLSGMIVAHGSIFEIYLRRLV